MSAARVSAHADIWAVVPVKDLDGAKQRLAGLLPPTQRRALAAAMLEDVLAALVAGAGPRRHPGRHARSAVDGLRRAARRARR